jgi:hypothetical protein
MTETHHTRSRVTKRLLPDTYRSGVASPCLKPADTDLAKAWARVRVWTGLNLNLISALVAAFGSHVYVNSALTALRLELYFTSAILGFSYCFMVVLAIGTTWTWLGERQSAERDGGGW